MHGPQIRVKIGDSVPVGPGSLTYLATDTYTPRTDEFQGADANKVAPYLVRDEQEARCVIPKTA